MTIQKQILLYLKTEVSKSFKVSKIKRIFSIISEIFLSLSLFSSSFLTLGRNDNFVWKNVKNFGSVDNKISSYLCPIWQGKDSLLASKANFSLERGRKCTFRMRILPAVLEICRAFPGSSLFFDLSHMCEFVTKYSLRLDCGWLCDQILKYVIHL